MNLFKLLWLLHPLFIIGFLVVWNVLMLWAVHLNGGFGQFKRPDAALISALATSLMAFLAFGALYTPAVRAYVLRPTASLAEVKPGLVLVGLVGTLLTIMGLLAAWQLSAS